ncbi:recombinase family protein [Paenarthrobacter sp. PH39-S1]|uniref:recombinase family protein n=1 Tax=Paenarthrobacter sp. PH39-S1 TaxID=3046204 RepID=UPI0024BBE839|nr:recombinase family protein [Paenarthrobacter sp. PH39-S1]MDJ0356056.1 recombinase family protein [Paenarthrobacter sp. PH39-S1]
MSSEQRRAATYLRISQDRENTRLGVDRHREDAEALIAARQWAPVGVYEDNDISGKGHKKRPAFERLLKDIGSGLIDVVVAQEWPRLERNRADGVRIIEAAQRDHVLLTFAKGSDIDCTTAAGRLSADMFSAIARNEIEVKAERQSRAQRQRAEQGRPPKGVRPLGYASNGDVIEHEAEAVRKIYAAFSSGASLRAIAAALSGGESENLPSIPPLPRHNRSLMIERNVRRAGDGLEPRPVPDDSPWVSSTIMGILRNPRYAGYSTYTPKEVLANGDRRRSWRAQILRDDHGEPILGTWNRIVDLDAWEAVQDRLDDPARVTNRVGTDRKHLGSGLYRCGVCDKPVKTHSQRYRCEGHVMRSREQIDDFVVETVRRRLQLPDLHDLLPSADEPRMREIKLEIAEHQARIHRAQRDYDNELIEGFDLKRIRDRENAAIDTLEVDRLRLSLGISHNSVLEAPDRLAAFDAGDLGLRRSTIEVLCEVRLFPHPRGVKTFNSDSVSIMWRSAIAD